MNINYKLVAGVALTILAWEVVAEHSANLIIKKQRKTINSRTEVLRYLADKLDNENIRLDEFDKIVLGTLSEI